MMLMSLRALVTLPFLTTKLLDAAPKAIYSSYLAELSTGIQLNKER